MHFSKHQRQHWQHLSMGPIIPAIGPPFLLNFFSTYCIIIRISCIRAMMNEPKATEPRWYLISLQKLDPIGINILLLSLKKVYNTLSFQPCHIYARCLMKGLPNGLLAIWIYYMTKIRFISILK
jgi:hypothetical protein